MVTEALHDVFERIKEFPAEDQDRIAAALRVMIEQPPVTSDVVRPEVMDAFHEMLGKTSAVSDRASRDIYGRHSPESPICGWE